MLRPLRVLSMGQVPYAQGLALQQALAAAVEAGKAPDTLLLLEHPPVITLGRNAQATHIKASHAYLTQRGIEVVETARGGDVTYHAPGQLVGYPILALQAGEQDLRGYVNTLERWLVATCAQFGVSAQQVPGIRGVFVEQRKIAAIGVRVARWITQHGFALNVTTDLRGFSLITPCGLTDYGVTSLAAECAAPPAMPEVVGALLAALPAHVQRRCQPLVHCAPAVLLADMCA